MLILSIFPGIDLLGRAFEEQGACVVRGPDVIWGGDIRTFHPPHGVFHGVIGGPPCQAYSSLAGFVRSKGCDPSFPDMTPEFIRVVEEAHPEWFLWENVRAAPTPAALSGSGYFLQVLLLNNRHLNSGNGIGPVQNRVRKFCYGNLEERTIHPDFAVFDNAEWEGAVLASEVKRGESKHPPLRGRSRLPAGRPLERLIVLQGLPPGFDLPGMTKEGKGKAIGNGVPLPMGRALAKAILA